MFNTIYSLTLNPPHIKACKIKKPHALIAVIIAEADLALSRFLWLDTKGMYKPFPPQPAHSQTHLPTKETHQLPKSCQALPDTPQLACL